MIFEYYTDNYNKNYITFPDVLPNNDPDDIYYFINNTCGELTLLYDSHNIKYIFYKKNTDLCMTIIKNSINISQIYITLIDKNTLLLLNFFNTITNNYIYNIEQNMNNLSIQLN